MSVILSAGIFVGSAQPSPTPAPFIVDVTNISSANVRVSVPKIRQDYASAVLIFHLVRDWDINFDELTKDGVRSKRLLRIVNGDRVIAEARLVGQAHGLEAKGFILAFDSAQAANKAAAEISKLGVIIIPKSCFDDQTFWIF